MQRLNYSILIVCCLIACFLFTEPFVCCAGAQESGVDESASVLETSKPIGLCDCYAYALNNDPILQAAEAGHNYYKAEVSKSVAMFRPSIDLSLTRGRNATENTTQGMLGPVQSDLFYNTERYSISLHQPLLNFATIASYKKATVLESWSGEKLDYEQSYLMVRVAEAYVNVLMALEADRYATVKQFTSKDIMAQTQGSFKAGFAAITDVKEADAALQLAVAEKQIAENDLVYALGNLKELIGFKPVQLLGLDFSSFSFDHILVHSLDDWVNMALESNSVIIAAREEVRIAQQEKSKNRAERYPKLDLYAGRTYSDSDNNTTIGQTYDTYSLNVQFSMPLYSGGYIGASIRQASAGIAEAEARVREQEQEVRREVRKYYNALIGGLAEIYAYEQAVQATKTKLDAVTSGFHKGSKTKADIAQAQERLAFNRKKLFDAKHVVLLNDLFLKLAGGQITFDDLKGFDDLLSTGDIIKLVEG